MSITDPRVGTLNPDGSIESYPATDVLGRAYDRPCTTQGIGVGFFVVLPLGGDFAAVVEGLKALVAPPVVEKKGRRADDAAE